jgi:carboxyl-terminal processing protease
VPSDEKDDKQLVAAIDLLHGVKRADATSPKLDSSAATPPAPPAPASGGDALPTPAPSPAPDAPK